MTEFLVTCDSPGHTGEANQSAQRRELCRYGEGARLLVQDDAFAARRRPLAWLHRRGPQALAFTHVLVGPDMDPLIEGTDVGEAREDQRRDGGALLDARGPRLDHLGDGARPVGVGAEFVEAAMLARLEMRREGRGMEDLGFHIEDEVRDLGRPDLGRDGFGANAVAFVHILVGPDMDDLVERAHFGPPIAGEARELGAAFYGARERLLGLGRGTGLQQVGADLENHRSSPLIRLFTQRRRPAWSGRPASPRWRSGRAVPAPPQAACPVPCRN